MTIKKWIGSFIVITVFTAAIASQPAVDLSGKWSAEGKNPGGKSSYKGEVAIEKTGDTYKVVWQVGVVYIGTGIVVHNVFSVAYVDKSGKSIGVVAYKILDNGRKLEGDWTLLGGKTLGTETLLKK